MLRPYRAEFFRHPRESGDPGALDSRMRGNDDSADGDECFATDVQSAQRFASFITRSVSRCVPEAPPRLKTGHAKQIQCPRDRFYG